MVSLYFGLPGAGKTTVLASHAYKTCKAIRKNKCPYDMVYSNIDITLPEKLSPYFRKIDLRWLGKYNISHALILIDEATLQFDSRDYKSFSQSYKEFFLLHRHYRVDIELYTQQWDGIDKKIRVITDRVYYLYKGAFTRPWFTRSYRVPYGIIIPDPKKDSSQQLGEIVQGYCKPNFLIRLFSPWFFRPRYYKYFDSFETPELPALPEEK